MYHSRILIFQLVIEVLADLLQDGRADLWELDLSQLSLCEAAWGHAQQNVP